MAYNRWSSLPTMTVLPSMAGDEVDTRPAPSADHRKAPVAVS